MLEKNTINLEIWVPDFILVVRSSKFVCKIHASVLIKKENKIFLMYKEIQKGTVAKSYMMKGFLIYEEIRKYLVMYEEEAFSHI
jgi:hypothetical protein